MPSRRCFMHRIQINVKLVFVMTLLTTLIGTNLVFAAGPKAVRKYPIPDHGILELNVPASWKDNIHKPQKDMFPTIIFVPEKGNDFHVLITIIWGKTGEQDFNSPTKIRTLVEQDGQNILPKAVETQLVLQQMRGVNNIGYFFSLTDKAPNPGEFLYLTRGGMAVGNLLLNATILYRAEDSEYVKDALSMLREAKQIIK
jgi:hypothetical protein